MIRRRVGGTFPLGCNRRFTSWVAYFEDNPRETACWEGCAEKGIRCRLNNCARTPSWLTGYTSRCLIVVLGGSSSDSSLPSTKALICHSRSLRRRRTYPKTWPFFHICQIQAFLKPSASSVRRRRSMDEGEMDSTLSHERVLSGSH